MPHGAAAPPVARAPAAPPCFRPRPRQRGVRQPAALQLGGGWGVAVRARERPAGASGYNRARRRRQRGASFASGGFCRVPALSRGGRQFVSQPSCCCGQQRGEGERRTARPHRPGQGGRPPALPRRGGFSPEGAGSHGFCVPPVNCLTLVVRFAEVSVQGSLVR